MDFATTTTVASDATISTITTYAGPLPVSEALSHALSQAATGPQEAQAVWQTH